ncbi:hypothetical protein BOTBODRAFT_45143 [Botryobasidium botryosum FD-172 SS1]|uniref:F-box domain-containing protein n=1 Tax=Botryobasidium botryosum (strain FD-172 SS1) TaxID=930990 RepID=A0A067MPB7_BOTB1|nr:hypothetical protein BOTBODRAFT_45143 [Botryobasidium botryosum FD-172 SS1]
MKDIIWRKIAEKTICRRRRRPTAELVGTRLKLINVPVGQGFLGEDAHFTGCGHSVLRLGDLEKPASHWSLTSMEAIIADNIPPLLQTLVDRIQQSCDINAEKEVESCRAWHSPAMGAYRRNGPPSPYGYLFSRSGNAPLHISARLCQETGSAECQARYCSQHISCCASLKLVFKNERSIHFDDVWAWLSQAAPSPEALYLYADDDAIRGIIPGKLFNGEVPPRLCHITLEGLHLPLTDRSFTNLTKLRIAGMYDCPVTYVIDVLQAINASPRLEELHMESICYEGGPDLDELVETAPHNIDLSHLQHLSFRFLDVWMVQFLLNRLTIPPRAKLEIAIEDLPCDQDLSDIFPVNPANLRNLQSIHTLAFATNDDRRGCIIEGGIMTALDGGTLSTLLIFRAHSEDAVQPWTSIVVDAS